MYRGAGLQRLITSRISCKNAGRDGHTHPEPLTVDERVDESVDEVGDEPAEEQVELQEDERPEQDLHATEIMLRRVHANLGHPSKGLMLRLLRDANAPPEMLTVARDFHCSHCDLMTRRTGAVRPVQVSRWTHHFN